MHNLEEIHKNLKLNYGSLQEELPEQIMTARFLTGNENILEIGGNIGRNSLVIASILSKYNNNNFVSMESNPDIAKQLFENRDLNNFNFHIECSALSEKPLIQKDWNTSEFDLINNKIPEGHIIVNTITWEQLINKYNILFDTLILDCEGAFFYILRDMPYILENINLIIIENDFIDEEHKKFIDNILINNNFYILYSEPGGWGYCEPMFYQVWKRNPLINK